MSVSQAWRVSRAVGLACLLICHAFHATAQEKGPDRQDTLRAAFLYNFLLFTEWPDDTTLPNDVAPIVIGIVGDKALADAFEAVEGRKVGGRELDVILVDEERAVGSVAQCQLLYFSPRAETTLEALADALAHHPVLTVGEGNRFCERGGMVNLLTRRDHYAFEVNTSAAERAGLTFSSQLLRLAARIVETDAPER